MPQPLAGPRNDARRAAGGPCGGAGKRHLIRPAGTIPSRGRLTGDVGGDLAGGPCGPCVCLTAGRGALFPGARKKFQNNFKVPQREKRIATAVCALVRNDAQGAGGAERGRDTRDVGQKVNCRKRQTDCRGPRGASQ